MLEKSTRKKLLEHDWVEIAKKDSNPHQTLIRLKKYANTSINDLILFAQRLPDEAQKEIFNYTNVNKLLKAILRWPVGYSTNDEVRRTELAGLLVRLGIWICIEQYRTKVEQDPVLNNLTINHLLRAGDICDAISFRLRKPQIEEEAKKEKLVYLFKWNRIRDVHEVRIGDVQDNDTRKFGEFLDDICLEEFGVPLDIINKIWTDINSFAPDIHACTEMLFEYTDAYDVHGTGSMRLDTKKKTGHLSLEVWDGVKTRIVKRDLVIKVENEDVLVYRNQ